MTAARILPGEQNRITITSIAPSQVPHCGDGTVHSAVWSDRSPTTPSAGWVDFTISPSTSANPRLLGR